MFASKYRSFALGFVEGQTMILDGTEIGFNTGSDQGLQFIYEKDSLSIVYTNDLSVRHMMGDGGEGMLLKKNIRHPLTSYAIYETEDFRFVLTDFNANGIIRYEQENSPQQAAPEMLLVVQSTQQALFFPVPKSEVAMDPNVFIYNDMKIKATWQPATLSLPFSVCLENFHIERYPGSQSPSEYRSMVTLDDQNKNISFPFEIYMNNILKYNGYRFYQSSFDQGEKTE